MSKKPDPIYLRIRTYPAPVVYADCWLIYREGAAQHGLMHGRLWPDKLAMLEKILAGVEIVREAEPEGMIEPRGVVEAPPLLFAEAKP